MLLYVVSRTLTRGHGMMSGARLGISDHTVDNSKIFTFALTDKERDIIEEILKQSNGSRMITTIGDCGAEYR